MKTFGSLMMMTTSAFAVSQIESSDSISSLRGLANGNLIGGLADKKIVREWNTTDGTVLSEWSMSAVVSCLTSSNVSLFIGTSSQNGLLTYSQAGKKGSSYLLGSGHKWHHAAIVDNLVVGAVGDKSLYAMSDADTATKLADMHTSKVTALESLNSKLLSGDNNGRLCVSNPGDAESPKLWCEDLDIGSVTALAVHSNWFAAAGAKGLKVFNMDYTMLQDLNETKAVTSLAVLADGRLASFSDSEVHLWNVQENTMQVQDLSGSVVVATVLASGELAYATSDNTSLIIVEADAEIEQPDAIIIKEKCTEHYKKCLAKADTCPSDCHPCDDLAVCKDLATKQNPEGAVALLNVWNKIGSKCSCPSSSSAAIVPGVLLAAAALAAVLLA